MTPFSKRLATLGLCAALCLPLSAGAVTIPENLIVRAGIVFDATALERANLENAQGSGYLFGYFSADRAFVPLASTAETKITMRAGAVHLQLAQTYPDIETAQTVAATCGGFIAWTGTEFAVRVGEFASSEAAVAAEAGLSLAGCTAVIAGPNAVTATRTSDSAVLFQMDGGTISLAVRPGLDGSTQGITWFKARKYYGDFQYQRFGGAALTVVNFVPLEAYIRGILPYEMSSSWPLEALKAQAVCARTYTIITLDKHTAQGFDLCTETDCQVYRGTADASENTDRAVAETSGVYARYGDDLAQTYYFSSDGGGTENSENVWSSKLPYLKGVMDPYEETVEATINQSYPKATPYRWAITKSLADITAKLREKGYACADIVSGSVTKTSPTGNPITTTFIDAAGAKWSFRPDKIRTWMGLRSVRFTLENSAAVTPTPTPTPTAVPTVDGFAVDAGGEHLPSLAGLYAIDGKGNVAQIPDAAYAASGAGTAPVDASGNNSGGGDTAAGGGSITFNGSGWGHNIGMSQWGAYAMAKLGKNYDEILKFYFTGIDVR